MAIYEFKCEKCGIQYETEISIHSEISANCCGQAMTRVWSVPSVKFNASGFYSTDNRTS